MVLVATNPNSARAVAWSTIREDILRDPLYPVHHIADRLLPYLRVLVEQFQPQRVIVFGSYVYGNPDQGSDVDLLVVRNYNGSSLAEKLRIRKAWEPIHSRYGYLSIHLLLETPARHRFRLQHSAGFYDEINKRGLRLV